MEQSDWILLAQRLFKELGASPSVRILMAAARRDPRFPTPPSSIDLCRCFPGSQDPLLALMKTAGLPPPPPCL